MTPPPTPRLRRTSGGKRVILGAVAVLLIVLGITVVAFLLPAYTPEIEAEAKARRLMAELRDPSAFHEWLIKLGLQQSSERRGGHVIARELAALGQSAVPVCVKALRHDDRRVRYWVADALRKMDPVPREAAPALIQSLNDEASDVRVFAAEALQKIQLAPAIPAAATTTQPGGKQ